MPEGSGRTQSDIGTSGHRFIGASGHRGIGASGHRIPPNDDMHFTKYQLITLIRQIRRSAEHYDFNLFRSSCAGFRLGIMRRAVSNQAGSLQVPLQKRDCPLIRIFQVFTSEAVPLIGINLDLVRYFVPGEDRI